MSYTKALSYGTCQICGSKQKLPDGVLAKHGYTKRFGYFSGTCLGSEKQPFETHKDYAELILRQTELDLLTLRPQLEAAELKAPKRNGRWIPECKRTLEEQEVDRLRGRIHDAKQYVAFQKPRCERWTVQPLRAVEEVLKTKQAAGVKRQTDKEVREDLKTRKLRLVRACDRWSAEFLRACDEAGIKRRQNEDAPAHYSWFNDWYYGTTPANMRKFVLRFMNQDPSDDRMIAVLDTVQPLVTEIDQAASALYVNGDSRQGTRP